MKNIHSTSENICSILRSCLEEDNPINFIYRKVVSGTIKSWNAMSLCIFPDRAARKFEVRIKDGMQAGFCFVEGEYSFLLIEKSKLLETRNEIFECGSSIFVKTCSQNTVFTHSVNRYGSVIIMRNGFLKQN